MDTAKCGGRDEGQNSGKQGTVMNDQLNYLSSIGALPVEEETQEQMQLLDQQAQSPVSQPQQPSMESQPQQPSQTGEREDYLSSIGALPVEEDEQDITQRYGLSELDEEDEKELKREKNKKRQERRENIMKAITQTGKSLSDFFSVERDGDDAPKTRDLMDKYDLEEVTNLFQDIIKMPKRTVQGYIGGFLQAAAGIGTLGTMALDSAVNNTTLSEDKKEWFSDSMAAFQDYLYPFTHQGQKKLIKDITGEEVKPGLQSFAFTFGSFLGPGLVFGKTALPLAAAESAGMAATEEALPESTPWWARMGLTVASGHVAKRGYDVAGVALGGKEALGREFGRRVRKSVRKGTDFTPKDLEIAEKLGLDIPPGVASGSEFVNFVEKMLARQTSTEKVMKAAAENINKPIINALEEEAGIKFSTMPEEAERLGARAQQAATEGKEALLSAEEAAYPEIADMIGKKPVKMTTSKKVFQSFEESKAVPPDQKKFYKDISKDLFTSGEELQTQVENLHPKSMSRIDAGERIQDTLKAKHKISHKLATDKYEMLGRVSKQVKLNRDAMAPVMDAIYEASEEGIPDLIQTQFKKISDRAELLNEMAGSGKGVSVKELIKFEKMINKAIKWDSEHHHTQTLIPLKKQVNKLIEKSLPDTLRAKYRDAKRSWWKHYENFVTPDAVRKMRLTQTPEEILRHIRNPSYFRQLKKQIGEKEANALKRMVVEDVFGKENISTGKIKPGQLDELKEYASVFGEDFEKIQETFTKASQKTGSSSDRIVNTISEINKKLKEPLSKAAKDRLLKARQSLIQDLKNSNPNKALEIEKSISKLTPVGDTLEANYLKSLTTGDPRTYLNKINSVDDLNAFKKLVYDTKNGKEIFDSTRRMKLQQKISEGIFKENGDLNIEKLTGNLSNLMETEFGRALMGKESAEFYKYLKKYNKEMSDSAYNLQRFVKESNLGPGRIMWASLGHAVYQVLLKGNPKFLFLHLGLRRGQKVVAKLLTDPKFKKGMLEALKETAGQGGRSQRDVALAMRRIQPVLKNVFEIIDEED